MSVWQFGGQYINVDTGAPASPEEVAEFKERHAKLDAIAESARVRREEEERQWHAKYDPIMREFFDWPEDLMEELVYNSAEELIYGLSTTIFDGTDDYDETKVRNSQVVAEIRKAFPEYVEEAVKAYLDGNHDT
jgi:hypothetical protein